MPRLRRVRKVEQLRKNIKNQQNSLTISNENSTNDDKKSSTTNLSNIQKLWGLPNQSKPNLLHLPNELIFQIAKILAEPSLIIQHWDHLNTDLINLSATCKSIRSITRSLLYSQVTITIEHSNPNRSLTCAINRIKKLSKPSHLSNHSTIKKLSIRDDGPDLSNSNKTRQKWYSLLSHYLNHQLSSIQFFCYSRNLESVTESSPYTLLTIDPNIIHSIANLKHLDTLYLSGLTIPERSPRIISSSVLPFLKLTTLHLIAVDDSMISLIKHCADLKELRVWRDFLIPFHTIQHWVDLQQWSTFENLKLKGFYGNSVVNLQNSLIETRQIINKKDSKINLNTLDLDEPYSANDLLRLLEAFKSPLLMTLRLTVWRDEDFGPALFERISEFFPNLEDFQIVLETPSRRWWPHKINCWGQSLSKMKKLRRFTWNCSPFTCHDLLHIQAGMKSQVMILAELVPTLERVAYVDISGWLQIKRKPTALANIKSKATQSSIIRCSHGAHGTSNYQSSGSIKSIKWAGVEFTYPALASTGFFDSDSEADDLPDEQKVEETDELENYKEDDVYQPLQEANKTIEAKSNQSSIEHLPVGEEADEENQSNDVRESNPKNEDLNRLESKPRRKSIDDPFSVTRSSNPSCIPNSSLTSKLTKLSSSVSFESDLMANRNRTRSQTKLSSTHLKPSSSSNTATTNTTTTSNKKIMSDHASHRHSRLINSHSYPDLLISQILEINRSNFSSHSHHDSSPSSSVSSPTSDLS